MGKQDLRWTVGVRENKKVTGLDGREGVGSVQTKNRPENFVRT